MKSVAKKATILSILGNFVLFILKIIIGVMYNSIAVISDAINSFTDIIASIIVFISLKVSGKKADKEHPFGHYRAEPIAGLVVAIFMGILGFEIIKIAVDRIIVGDGVIKGVVPIIAMSITLVLKLFMYLYTNKVSKKVNSPALVAMAVDHRNDVLICIAVLVGLGGAYFGYGFLDPLAAIIVGLWIIYSGFKVGMDNLKFLIGGAPSEELMEKIKEISLDVDGVKGVNDVNAHYVGVLVQVEVHIEVDRKITVYRAHTIGKKVQVLLEELEDIDRAFVHIDPVK